MNSSFDYNPFTPREEDDKYDLDLFHFWPNYAHKATFMAIHDGLSNKPSPQKDGGLTVPAKSDLTGVDVSRYSVLMDLN